jgi:hypothetical protein
MTITHEFVLLHGRPHPIADFAEQTHFARRTVRIGEGRKRTLSRLELSQVDKTAALEFRHPVESARGQRHQ